MEAKTQSLNIIVPPAEVRTLIGKTAVYVNKNGIAFENKIRAKENNNPKFVFLNFEDPYHGYYQFALESLRTTGKIPEILSKKKTKETACEDTTEQIEEKLPLGEPSSYQFVEQENDDLIYKEDGISDIDLKVIKLVAQFAVVNGDKIFNDFRKHVLNNSQLKSQFLFLNSSHSMHHIFVKYMNIYRLIYTNKEAIISKYSEDFNREKFLNTCFNAAEYYQKEASLSKRLKKQEEKEKMAFESIDWLDFEVVETVHFTQIDEISQLSRPLNKADLEYRSLVEKEVSIFDQLHDINQDSDGEEDNLVNEGREIIEGEDDDGELPRYENTGDNETEDDENTDIETVSDEKTVTATPSPRAESETSTMKPQRKVPRGVKLKAAGESRLLKRRYGGGDSTNVHPAHNEKLLLCPITKELIPESKFQSHFSSLLRDPKYKEERERYESKFRYGDNLSPQGLYENLQSLFKEPSTKKRKI